MKLEIGNKFTSPWIGEDTLIEIIDINYKTFELSIKYKSRYGSINYDSWNLQHVICAFERGEYKLIKDVNEKYLYKKIDIKDISFKNNQIEDEGAYAD